MEKGDRVKILVGTGHRTATSQGPALEYITNIHNDLVKRGLRDKAKIMWISHEPKKLGDLGVGGITARQQGYISGVHPIHRLEPAHSQNGVVPAPAAATPLRTHSTRRVEAGIPCLCHCSTPP